jgi:hypothetical protein
MAQAKKQPDIRTVLVTIRRTMFESKVIMNLALLFAFAGAAVGSITLWKITTQSESFLSTTSPKGTYTVRLTGRKDRPKLPFLNHQVLFSVSREEKVVVANRYLHSGDWFDPSFEILYPDHAWENDEILHFYKKEFFADGQPEQVVVLNKTTGTIQHLCVTSVDTFLLFDIQPESTTRLVVSRPRGDSRWIKIEGQFSDGTPIQGRGVGFVFPKSKQLPFTYYIYIDKKSFTIESPDLREIQSELIRPHWTSGTFSPENLW